MTCCQLLVEALGWFARVHIAFPVLFGHKLTLTFAIAVCRFTSFAFPLGSSVILIVAISSYSFLLVVSNSHHTLCTWKNIPCIVWWFSIDYGGWWRRIAGSICWMLAIGDDGWRCVSPTAVPHTRRALCGTNTVDQKPSWRMMWALGQSVTPQISLLTSATSDNTFSCYLPLDW